MSESCPRSRTLQMETDEIVTVVFGEDNRRALIEAAERIKRIFDQDIEHYLITICVSEVYDRSQHYEEAYREVQQLLRQRTMNPETQVIVVKAEHADLPVYRESDLEMLFKHLEQGNAPSSVALAESLLDQLRRKQATALQFKQLAERIVMKRDELAVMTQRNYRPHRLLDAARINQCFTTEQLSRYLQSIIETICIQIEEHKSAKDDVLEFVFRYLEQNYNEDVSLDTIAGKIHLSPGYLSNYIKQKTGTNFSDHVMEVRIRKAKALLTDSTEPIAAIAEQIGYYNVTSFNRWFKKVTGLSPGEFRKNTALKP